MRRKDNVTNANKKIFSGYNGCSVKQEAETKYTKTTSS